MKESNPKYQEINWIAQLICWATNPQLLFNMQQPDFSGMDEAKETYMDMGEPERAALIQTLKESQAKLLKGTYGR